MYLNGFSIFLIKVQVNREIVTISKSYSNRKVPLSRRLIGRSNHWNMFISVIRKQKRPLADNKPHAEDATDPTADNGKRRTE